MSADLSSTPRVCVCVCGEGQLQSVFQFARPLLSAAFRPTDTGVFPMGGISAHLPAGIQQAAPERVRS